jgi:hypothetical protein
MGHQRQVKRIGGFERHFQRAKAQLAGDRAADAHLHADDAVAVGLDLGHAFIHRQHRAQRRFADRDALVEAENAGERDVEEGEDPVGRVDHHVVAETVIVAGAGAAGIDQRGAGGATGDEAGVDAERGRLVVDMGVDVDQPRRDDGAADVLDLGPRRRQVLAQRGDPAGFDCHIEHPVYAVAFVEDAAALQHDIEALSGCR